MTSFSLPASTNGENLHAYCLLRYQRWGGFVTTGRHAHVSHNILFISSLTQFQFIPSLGVLWQLTQQALGWACSRGDHSLPGLLESGAPGEHRAPLGDTRLPLHLHGQPQGPWGVSPGGAEQGSLTWPVQTTIAVCSQGAPVVVSTQQKASSVSPVPTGANAAVLRGQVAIQASGHGMPEFSVSV